MASRRGLTRQRYTAIATVVALIASLMMLGAGRAQADSPPQVTFTTMAKRVVLKNPYGITSGPDGNIWFVNTGDDSIGRITPSGRITPFIGAGISYPVGITTGPDGNLWFTNFGNDSIGRITPSGVVSNFTGLGISDPFGIATGPDGNLWFTNRGNNSIGMITPAGAVSNFTGLGISDPFGITAGPDGNLWFTNRGNNSIGMITPAGVVSNFTDEKISEPFEITAGQGSSLWFTNNNDSIGMITPDGTVSRFTDPGIAGPRGLSMGPDGNLWFTNYGNDSIGMMTPDGVVSNHTNSGLHQPWAITTGPDGNLWFTTFLPGGSHSLSAIGRIAVDGEMSLFNSGNISGLSDITTGPDGNLWFVTQNNEAIGSITPSGAVSDRSYGLPITPYDLASGPDGKLWFTNTGFSSIGMVDANDAISSFTAPELSRPYGITTGSDDNLWFTDLWANVVGMITTDGAISTFTDESISYPLGIAGGPDGNLWFANSGNDSIGMITPGGVVSNFTDQTISFPIEITAGPDGNLWFTNRNGNSIGMITPEGIVSNFTDSGISSPWGITAGPDGNLWFTNQGNDSIGMITPDGVVSNFTDASISEPLGITAGPDGNIWFTNFGNDSIMRINLPGAPGPTHPSAPRNVTAIGGNGQATVSWYTPHNDGGSSITGYTVTSDPEGRTCTTTGAVTCTVTGLTNGTEYSFTVNAHNAIGDSVLSAPSNEVTPVEPVTGAFHPMTPARIIDSRPSSKVGPFGSPWGQGATRDITVAGNAGVPADATGVVLNVTGVEPTLPTYLTVWPKGDSRPTASNLNLPPGDVRPNLVMSALGTNGKVSLFNNLGNTHVVVDVVGWYGPGDDASYFNELSPSRIWDTRPAPENVGPLGKLGQGQTKDLKVTGVGGVPTGATAVVLNVTAVNPSYSTYVTAWPKGQTRPTASNLNAPAGDVRPNLIVAKVGTDGKVSFFNNAGNTDLVVDVVGYFADTGSQFNGMTPKRVWDSRPAPENVGPLGKLGQGQSKSITVAGVNGVPADAKAVVVNITGVSPSYPTYITAWPTGESRPMASNLNLSTNTVIPNLAVVKVGAGGKISFYNHLGTTDVVVDVVGWYK